MRIFIHLLLIFPCFSVCGQSPYSVTLPKFELTSIYKQQLEVLKNKSIAMAIPPASFSVKGKVVSLMLIDSCIQIKTGINVKFEDFERVTDVKLASDELANLYFAFMTESESSTKTFAKFVVGKLDKSGQLEWIRKIEIPSSFSENIFLSYISICSNNTGGVFLCFTLNQGQSSIFQTVLGKIELDSLGNTVSTELYKSHEGIRELRGCWSDGESVYVAMFCTNCNEERITINKFKGSAQGVEVRPVILKSHWLSRMSDVTRDDDGNLYFIGRSSSTSNLIMCSLKKDGSPRWCYEYNESLFLFSRLSYHKGSLSLIHQVGDQTSRLLVFDTTGVLVRSSESKSFPLGVPAITVINENAMAVFAEPHYFGVIDTTGWDGCDTLFRDWSNLQRTIIEVVNGVYRNAFPKGNTSKSVGIENMVVNKRLILNFNCNTGLFGSSLLADTLLCYGNELELSPEVFGDTAGLKYKWNTGATDKNLVTNQSGVYKLNITNGACSHNHQTHVLMADEARALVPDSLELCPEDTGEIALNPLFKNSVYWYKPDSSIDENTRIRLKDEGPYYLNSNQAHCLEIDSVSVKTLNEKTLDAGQDSLICYGQEIGLNASGAKKYQWQPSSLFTNGNDTLANPKIKPKADVKVKLQAINLNGCEEDDSFLISVRDPLKIEIQQNDTSLCEGDSFKITSKASGGLAAQYEYVWDGNATKSDSFSLPLFTSQNLKVALKDQCSEPAFDSIQLNITEVEKAEIAYQPNPAMAGKIIQFSNPNKVYDSVKWLVNDTFFNQVSPNNHVFGKEGEYQITQLVYQKGCADSNLLRLTVGDQLIYFYPNVFSPNGDGINDEWFIKGHSIAYVDLRIFNIWGERIFWFEGTQVKWDGAFRDQPAPIGDYIFMATLTANNSEKVEVQGQFVLVK